MDHTGNNLLSKIIIARVIDHTGNNLLGKIIIARVVNFYVKSHWSITKVIRILLLTNHLGKNEIIAPQELKIIARVASPLGQ